MKLILLGSVKRTSGSFGKMIFRLSALLALGSLASVLAWLYRCKSSHNDSLTESLKLRVTSSRLIEHGEGVVSQPKLCEMIKIRSPAGLGYEYEFRLSSGTGSVYMSGLRVRNPRNDVRIEWPFSHLFGSPAVETGGLRSSSQYPCWAGLCEVKGKEILGRFIVDLSESLMMPIWEGSGMCEDDSFARTLLSRASGFVEMEISNDHWGDFETRIALQSMDTLPDIILQFDAGSVKLQVSAAILPFKGVPLATEYNYLSMSVKEIKCDDGSSLELEKICSKTELNRGLFINQNIGANLRDFRIQLDMYIASTFVTDLVSSCKQDSLSI